MRPIHWALVIETAALAVAVSMLAHGRNRPQVIREPAAPAVTQADGSIVLERLPEPPPRLPVIPAGAVVDRVAVVKLEPIPDHKGPLTLELVTVLEPSGARRAVVAAEGGRIVGGVDYAPRPPTAAQGGPWAFGPALGVDMDGRRRLGAAAAWGRGRTIVTCSVTPGIGGTIGIIFRF